MSRSRHTLPELMYRTAHSRLALILQSVFIGFIVGFVIALFRYLLTQVDALRRGIYAAPHSLPYWLAWAAALGGIGLFLGWTAKTWPLTKGSGIPQIKGALMGVLPLQVIELPVKLVSGLLGLGTGLSLGREGPSVQIGAYVSKGVVSLFPKPEQEAHWLIAGGAAAGVAAAFNAPLAGVLFVLEELQASFSPLFLACAMGASMSADAVAGFFFGLGPVFDFRYIQVLALVDIPWIILLGVICGLLGDLFKRLLYGALNSYDRLRIPPLLRPVIPVLVSLPLGLLWFDLLGGGHDLIESLAQGERTLPVLALLLAGKILFTVLSYGSGTAGGIFLPLLVCGALTGNMVGLALGHLGLIEAGHNLNFIILGMAAFFTSVVKAPITGIVLILEMSANFNHLGNLVLVCFCALITSELINSLPVYTVLLQRLSPPCREGVALDRPAPRGP
ncbi:MAG: ClC family H(+)/Cl(-) exchange transporter [Spirochaetaceae bacterium]|jgi:H+/Cl- antiporter ClcA|nr:ClC family H(+)/Cl(-) exchange transporter [Spirochaetaceae bacterium]